MTRVLCSGEIGSQTTGSVDHGRLINQVIIMTQEQTLGKKTGVNVIRLTHLNYAFEPSRY